MINLLSDKLLAHRRRLCKLLWVVLLSQIPGLAIAQSLTTQHTLLYPVSNPVSVAFSPDGKMVAVGGDNGGKIHSLVTGADTALPVGFGASNVSVYFSPTGKTVATLFLGLLNVFDVPTGQRITSINFGGGYGVVFAFSPDGSEFVVGGQSTFQGGALQVWNAATFKTVKSFNTIDGAFYAVAFSPDGKSLADARSTSSGIGVELWNVPSGKLTKTFQSSAADGATSLAFSPNGKLLAVGGKETEAVGVLELWNTSTGTRNASLETGANAGVTSVAFSPDGKTLADSGAASSTGPYPLTGVLELWKVSTGKLDANLESSPNFIASAIAFSPDGKTLAHVGHNVYVSGSSLAPLDLWNVSSRTLADSINMASPSALAGVAFSPDGNSVAAGISTLAGSVTTFGVGVWNTSTGKPIQSLKSHANQSVKSVAFSPDGKYLADGGVSTVNNVAQGILELWNVATGKAVASLTPAVNSVVNSVAFSPDGKILADGGLSSNGSGLVELWNVSAGNRIAILQATALGSVQSVAFSPDGKTLALGGGAAGGILQLWDVATERLVMSLPTDAGIEVNCVAFSSDGTKLADGGVSPSETTQFYWTPGVLETWDVATGSLIESGTGGPPFYSVAFSPDNKVLFGAVYTFFIAESLEYDALLLDDQDFEVLGLAVSRSGSQLALSGGSLILALNQLEGAVPISSLTLSPLTVLGGETVTGKVTLTEPAPPGGLLLTLFADNTAVIPPPSIVIAGGEKSVSFPIGTSGVTAVSPVHVTAYGSMNSQTATVTINPSVLASITLDSPSVVGGNTLTGAVTLQGAADAQLGTWIQLACSNSAVSIPARVFIPAGQTSATFMVTTSGVSTAQSSNLTATWGGVTVSSTLQVTTATLYQLTLNPYSVSGGKPSTATVTLNGSAGPNGLIVLLSSNNACASVLASVTIPAGTSSAIVTVKTIKVADKTAVTIKATQGTASQTATLTIL